ncbi:MAG TPA: FAD-dependent oxidoreductase [Herpetosiphonaceae bacterium]
MKLAIIGAGLAGLAAAHKLRHSQSAIEIVLFEKSRGLGGRAATRRLHSATFDHGAQYIKAPTPELEALLREGTAQETLRDIGLPVWTFDQHNQIAEGDPEQNSDPKWTYSDGITRIAKELAQGLDIRRQLRIGHIAQANGSYILFDEQDAIVGVADAVLLTPPAPQTHDLIAASALPKAAQEVVLAELARVSYRPCLTVTLGYPPKLHPRPFYALVNTDRQHPISWLAYEHLKPGRASSDQHVVIAQMAPEWSTSHWNDNLSQLTEQVAALVSALLDEDLGAPLWGDRQGWRYALPDGCADFDTLNSAIRGLFFAGDYTAGQGRVHLAIEQGWRVAEKIIVGLDKS